MACGLRAPGAFGPQRAGPAFYSGGARRNVHAAFCTHALGRCAGPQPGERPTGFIALLLPAKGNDLHLVDAGIAAQTMQLAAASRGWGCCIMQAFDHQAAPQLLAVPAEYAMTLVLAFGAANEKRVLAPMPTTGNAPYWRDAQGVHYVPKRELKDLVLARY